MLDPNFDPLRELQQCQHNVSELIKGMNHHSDFIREISIQHEQLTKLLRDQNARLSRLELELQVLKSKVAIQT